MIIYQALEIQSRELSSRLLLGLVAASRGHSSLIAHSSHLKYLATRGGPKGIFHAKSTGRDQTEKLELHGLLRSKGFMISSLDEESGVLNRDFEEFGRNRYSAPAISAVDRVFAWGKLDFNWLLNSFPEYRDKFRLTGSPRVDLLRSPCNNLFSPPIAESYILISSNFAIWNFEPIWSQSPFSRRKRDFEVLPSKRRRQLKRVQSDFFLALEFAELAETLATEFADRIVVFRPHPRESVESWRDLLPDLENLLLTKDFSTNEWISGADVVIHNGCTTGMEAAVNGVPTISFQPSGDLTRADWFSNRVSPSAQTKDEVVGLVRDSVVTNRCSPKPEESGVTELANRLFMPTERMSAELMVKEWEKLARPTFDPLEKVEDRVLSNFEKVKLLLRIRAHPMRSEKIPGFNEIEVRKMIKSLTVLLGLQLPNVEVIGNEAVYITPAQ